MIDKAISDLAQVALFNEALEAAMNVKDVDGTDPAFVELCASGDAIAQSITTHADALAEQRELLAQFIQRVGDSTAPPAIKLALTRIWRVAHIQVDVACKALGR